MTTPASAALRKTALYDTHRKLGAKMVNFGGWDMPLEYSGILSEHGAVRARAGLFDVSHMGEIEIHGSGALDLVQWITCNDAAKLSPCQAQYSGLMTEGGTFADDLLVHKISATRFLLCVNAANQDGDFEHIVSENRFDAQVENAGSHYSQLAIQGPRAKEILERMTPTSLDAIRYYHFTFGRVSGIDCLIARTGYTGEDGFEIYFGPESSEALWNNLLDAGKSAGLLPCGLGARNTLRIEAGLCLYGHEIDETTTPWEAGLGWICKLEKGPFLGSDALARQRQAGVRRKLIGFEMLDKRIGRDGYPVRIAGREAGRVTSGGPAPSLKKNIGMAYVSSESSAIGTRIEIGIRGQWAPASIVALPFYKRRD
ncbi:MAG TPA: glycine cleavage system aminomethyltransferase GcvT [Candidatus Polarisedimenticolia bacterium]|nr:glycine cleavage system aminomethyltransferase GcvT [Candidatus Polarisedimenticolia bacterium]